MPQMEIYRPSASRALTPGAFSRLGADAELVWARRRRRQEMEDLRQIVPSATFLKIVCIISEKRQPTAPGPPGN